jgi:hypothetical protein
VKDGRPFGCYGAIEDGRSQGFICMDEPCRMAARSIGIAATF